MNCLWIYEKKNDLIDFELGMTVGARIHGASISETIAFVKYFIVVVKLLKDWTVRLKTWFQSATFSCHRLVNTLKKRMVSRFVKDNRRISVQHISADLNQGSFQSISKCTDYLKMYLMGHGSQRLVWTSLLSAANKIKRLKFAKEHENLAVDNWK